MKAIDVERIKQLIKQGNLAPFYNSSAWRRLRGEILHSDRYECQHCRTQRKRYVRATTVHHVNHVKKHPELALSKMYKDVMGIECRQLISLCSDCHKAEHPEEHLRINPNPLTEEWW